jgi:hypothetical protein
LKTQGSVPGDQAIEVPGDFRRDVERRKPGI